MNIATTLDQTATISFEYKGELVEMQVLEESLTPQFSQALKDVDENPRELAVALASVTRAWNIDYNGEPFPPSFDNLKRLPMSFYNAAVEAIAETFGGKSQTSSESANGSAPAAKLKVA